MADLPRLAFEKFPADLAARLTPRIDRLGYLGEFFQCAAHQPEALAAFMDFTEYAKDALPTPLVEIAALTCAGWMGNDYERNQHERLCVRSGFARAWIAAVNALAPEMQTALSPQEQKTQTLVLEILKTRGHGARNLFDAAVGELGAAQAMALLMVIGRYVTHALIVNVLALSPPAPSIFEDGFSP